jgi:hypothetical protein
MGLPSSVLCFAESDEKNDAPTAVFGSSSKLRTLPFLSVSQFCQDSAPIAPTNLITLGPESQSEVGAR